MALSRQQSLRSLRQHKPQNPRLNLPPNPKKLAGTPVMLRVQFLIAPEERDLEFGFEPASLQQTTMGFFSGDSVAAVIKRVANKSRVLLKGQEINEAKKLGLLLREPVGASGKMLCAGSTTPSRSQIIGSKTDAKSCAYPNNRSSASDSPARVAPCRHLPSMQPQKLKT